MIKVLEIKKNFTEDEMFGEVCATEVKYSNNNKDYYVTTFRADETIDIYVTETEDVFKSLCIENFFADDYEFQDKLDNLSLESYHEITDDWSDGFADSIYVEEINYCLYKMEQFMSQEEDADLIEDENLDKIDYVTPNYVCDTPEDEGLILQEYQVCKCNGPKLIDIQYLDEKEEITTEQIEIYNQEANNLCFNFKLFTLNKEQLERTKKLIKESGLNSDENERYNFQLINGSLFILNHSEGNKDLYEEVFTKEVHKLIYDIANYLDGLGFEIYDILEATRWTSR